MLKSNSEKEILYIFLWLIGIILLYTLVFKFILEPSTANNTHASKHQMSAHIPQEATEKTKKVVVAIANVAVPKVMAPVIETKPEVVIKVEEIAVNNVQSIPPKETIAKTVEESETKTSITVEKTVPSETIKKEKIENVVQQLSPPSTPIQTISIPSVPTVVSMPKNTVSIPSTPSVPSIPSIPSTQKVPAPLVQVRKVEIKENKKTILETKTLENVLSADEEIRLLDTARQHVIEKAEAARNEAMKVLDR